jgi:hypothetical protein
MITVKIISDCDTDEIDTFLVDNNALDWRRYASPQIAARAIQGALVFQIS